MSNILISTVIYLLALNLVITSTTDPSPECIDALSCKNVKCSRGHICIMEEVICITKPCCPVPRCVDICSLNTCRNKVCLPNQKCIMKQVMQCLLAPCCATPTCVD